MSFRLAVGNAIRSRFGNGAHLSLWGGPDGSLGAGAHQSFYRRAGALARFAGEAAFAAGRITL